MAFTIAKQETQKRVHERYFMRLLFFSSRELLVCINRWYKYSSLSRTVHFLKSTSLIRHVSVQQILQQQSKFASLALSYPWASMFSVWGGSEVFASGEIEIYSSVSMLFGSVSWAFLSSWRGSCATLKGMKGKPMFVLLWWFERRRRSNTPCLFSYSQNR